MWYQTRVASVKKLSCWWQFSTGSHGTTQRSIHLPREAMGCVTCTVSCGQVSGKLTRKASHSRHKGWVYTLVCLSVLLQETETSDLRPFQGRGLIDFVSGMSSKDPHAEWLVPSLWRYWQMVDSFEVGSSEEILGHGACPSSRHWYTSSFFPLSPSHWEMNRSHLPCMYFRLWSQSEKPNQPWTETPNCEED